MDKLNHFKDWCNENSGFISILIFIASLWIGWMLNKLRKPKLSIRIIPKMSFYSLFAKENDKGKLIHGIVCFSIYVTISNIGNKATSIKHIELGYKSDNKLLLNKRHWIKQTHILDDFIYHFKNGGIVYPLLRTYKYGEQKKDEFLEIGKSIIGIVYFEQIIDLNSIFPKKGYSGQFPLKLKITDIYGKVKTKKLKLNRIEIDEARKINSYFGKTYDELMGA